MQQIDLFNYKEAGSQVNSEIKEKIYKGKIKNEINGNLVSFNNSANKEINLYSMFMDERYPIKEQNKENGFVYSNSLFSDIILNREEVLFMRKFYGTDFSKLDSENYVLKPSIEYIKKYQDEFFQDGGPIVEINYIIDNELIEYLTINYARWPKGTSANAMDQSYPNLFYYEGIWENPLLTDSIIDKIKNT